MTDTASANHMIVNTEDRAWVTTPSDRFCSTDETITRDEWVRRWAETYGGGAGDRKEPENPGANGESARRPGSCNTPSFLRTRCLGCGRPISHVGAFCLCSEVTA